MVARFLGLLELYREGVVLFDQVTALAELQVTWVPEDERPQHATGAEVDEPDEDTPNGPARPDRAVDEEYAR